MAGKHELDVKVVAVVISKARTDQAFKEKLLASPNAALADFNITVPSGVNVTFVEDTATTWHFVIPGPRPDGELSDDDLEQASGGFGQQMHQQAQLRMPGQ